MDPSAVGVQSFLWPERRLAGDVPLLHGALPPDLRFFFVLGNDSLFFPTFLNGFRSSPAARGHLGPTLTRVVIYSPTQSAACTERYDEYKGAGGGDVILPVYVLIGSRHDRKQPCGRWAR